MRNKLWDDSKMNRLAKQIKDNALSDRQEAESLLATCKEAMSNLTGLLQIISMGEDAAPIQSADTLQKLISAAATSLTQMGNANEKLLKLATLLQKYRLKEMDNDKASGADQKNSLFNSLAALTNQEKDGKKA